MTDAAVAIALRSHSGGDFCWVALRQENVAGHEANAKRERAMGRSWADHAPNARHLHKCASVADAPAWTQVLTASGGSRRGSLSLDLVRQSFPTLAGLAGEVFVVR